MKPLVGLRKRRWWVAVSLILLAAVVWQTARSRPPARPPNVILLVVDTLRADHVGIYGYPRNTSPSLDRFSREAVVFENTVSTSPWTLPAVASILTAHYPTVDGLRFRTTLDSVPRLSPELPTLAEAFKQNGYRTVGISTNPWVTDVAHGLSRGFDDFRTPGTLKGLDGMETPAETVYADARRDLLRASEGAPLFLYLHFMDVHGPYNADTGADLGPIPSRFMRRIEKTPPSYLWKRGVRRLEVYVDAYDQGIRAWDDAFGEWLDWLERSGLLDDSIIFVTSDHGEELMERGGWNHGTALFAEQIDVPAVLRIPGGSPEGSVESLMSLVDVGRTLLAAAGLEAAAFPGRNMLDLGDSGDPARTVLSEAVGAVELAENPSHRSIRYGPRKVIDRADYLRCYDLIRDPEEKHSLRCSADDERRLRRFVLTQERLASAFSEGGESPLDPEAAERLRSLGYLE